MVILTLFLLALILAVVEAALFLALELELSGMMTGFWIMSLGMGRLGMMLFFSPHFFLFRALSLATESWMPCN